MPILKAIQSAKNKSNAMLTSQGGHHSCISGVEDVSSLDCAVLPSTSALGDKDVTSLGCAVIPISPDVRDLVDSLVSR